MIDNFIYDLFFLNQQKTITFFLPQINFEKNESFFLDVSQFKLKWTLLKNGQLFYSRFMLRSASAKRQHIVKTIIRNWEFIKHHEKVFSTFSFQCNFNNRFYQFCHRCLKYNFTISNKVGNVCYV